MQIKAEIFVIFTEKYTNTIYNNSDIDMKGDSNLHIVCKEILEYD